MNEEINQLRINALYGLDLQFWFLIRKFLKQFGTKTTREIISQAMERIYTDKPSFNRRIAISRLLNAKIGL